MSNLRRLALAVVHYQGLHRGRPPAALDDLIPLLPRSRTPASPFDPAGHEPGYVYIAASAGAPQPAVMFHDAAELRRIGHAHGVHSHGGQAVVTTFEQVGRQSSVTLP